MPTGEDGATLARLEGLFPLYSEELGIDLERAEGRFRWFVASMLFGARIGEGIAARAYTELESVSSSPEALLEAGWGRLVELLDSGGYARYDFSTATKLLDVAARLLTGYGSLEGLRERASSEAELERILQSLKGIGPATTQIFLRELRGVWDIKAPVSEPARAAGRRLGLDLENFGGEELARVETALVKLHLRFCKKRKCRLCPMEGSCEGQILEV
jgi:endonuclease III